MDAKFRPIPITIMDFLGVLVPGFLWAILLAKTYHAVSDPSARLSGIAGIWEPINRLSPLEKGWLGPLLAILAALVAGYSLKPLAMPVADYLCRPAFALMPSVRNRKARWWTLTFPFREYFDKQASYGRVCGIIGAATGLDAVTELPGSEPFAAAKRYLHAAAPALWEESERMEAEVRMAGALFLAAVYSVLLNLVLSYYGYVEGTLCAVLSALASIALAFGFCILRLREVEYTYLNLILADGLKINRGAQGSQAESAEDED